MENLAVVERHAVILVDHGSTVEKANRDLEELAVEAGRLAATAVYPAHMDLARPTIKEAYDEAVAEGASYIIVVPHFLAEGRHSQTDIPRLVGEAAAGHPGTRYHVSTPIGMDPAMSEVIARRVLRCVDSDGECDDCRLCCNEPEMAE